MRIMFIEPRMHTNQAPILEGLVAKGHQVSFLAQIVVSNEDHSAVQPIIMKRSFLSKLSAHSHNMNKNNSYKHGFFFPDVREFWNNIRSFAPDVVIVRQQPIRSQIMRMIIALAGCKCVIGYNQIPLSKKAKLRGKKLFEYVYRKLFDIKVQMTPTADIDIDLSNSYCHIGHKYFVPFVQELHQCETNHDINNKIRILDVGKYRDYKNHLLFVEAARQVLSEHNEFEFTIVGQVLDENERKIYNELEQRIRYYELEKDVSMIKNVPYYKMGGVYSSSDALVLASKRELASVAVLEAMSYGLAVISTDHNGTNCYITASQCGSLFKTCDVNSLSDEIIALKSKQRIKQLGERGRKFISEQCTIERYIKCIINITKTEWGITLEA